MKDLNSIFKSLSTELEKRNVNCILVGGWALNFYGVSRQTIDIDFMIDESSFAEIRELMEKNKFAMVFKNELVSRFKTDEGMIPVFDFIFVEARTFERLLKNAKKIQLGGADFKIPSLENIVAMKVHSLRNNYKNRYAKDFPDIVNLINTNPVELTDSRIRAICDKYGAEEIYGEITKAI